MQRRTALFGLSLAAMALGVWRPRNSGAASEHGIAGAQAPELDVDYWIDKDGNPTSFHLADAEQKWVYLYCFQNWCPGCHSHGFPTIQKISRAFADENRVVAVAVQTVFEGFSVNTVASVRKIQRQYDLPITMGHDPGDPNGDHRPKTMREYRTGGTPWAVLISPAGKVVFNGFHPDADKVINFIGARLTA